MHTDGVLGRPGTGEGSAVSTLRTRETSGACSLWYIYRHWRYAILFYSLLLTLAVAPLHRALGLPTSLDRKSTRLNSSHIQKSRMPSSA